MSEPANIADAGAEPFKELVPHLGDTPVAPAHGIAAIALSTEDADDGLDEFMDHPSCGLRADGTCAIADSDYCYRHCPKGNVGGPG